eukprot:GFUD01036125.1.p1 GENE.GFUD01036125.1~~GFUD01036125.1.p1  ORF type:complete len:350 (-),score=67.35 GFUD01036125.1:53-1102(-)
MKVQENLPLSCWEEAATCGECQNETMIFSVAESSVMVGVASVFSVLGFVINFITIVALMMNTRVRQQVTTPYILSALFANLIFCSVPLPILATRYYTRHAESNFSSGLCTVFPVVFYACAGSFILSLMSVTVSQTGVLFFQDREGKIYDAKFRTLTILLCWLLPLAILIPSMSGSNGTIERMDYTQICTIAPDEQGRQPFKLFNKLFIILPYTVMIICILLSFVKLKMVSSKAFKTSDNAQAESRFILCLFFVFLYFLLTTFPAWAVVQFDVCYQYPTLYAIAYMLEWSGIIANPIIFLVTQKSYRVALRRLHKKVFVAVQLETTLEQSKTIMHIQPLKRVENFPLLRQ